MNTVFKQGRLLQVTGMIVLLFLGGFASNATAASGNKNGEDAQSFHRAGTEQERALEAILQYNEDHYEVLVDLRRGFPVEKAASDQVELMITAGLMAAWRNEEQALLNRNCGGKWIEGEICGLDYDPLACAQDNPEYYLYRTEQQDNETATITVKWGEPPQSSSQATYRMVKRDGVWKLDGVRCTGGGAFNMPE